MTSPFFYYFAPLNFNGKIMSAGKKSVLLITLILVADQILKIWVKTHMQSDRRFIFLVTGELFISLKTMVWHLGWKWEVKPGNFI